LALIAAGALIGAFLGVINPAISSADNASGCDFSPLNNGVQGCTGPLSGSTFAGGDGNLAATPTTFGSTDWQNVAGLHAGIDLPSGTGDNSFGQGTKEDNAAVTVVSGSIPPNKSDLTRFYEASEFVNNSNFLYLAWERTNNLGSANMDFEINQAATPNLGNPGPHTIIRTAGDLLVTFDFTNGGGTPTLGLLRWVTSGATSQCFSSNSLPCWGNHVTLNGTDSIGAVNNLDTVTDPIAPNAPRSLPALTFGETAINLSTAGVFPPGTCEAFGSTFLKSRASASFGSEVKDFVAPVPVNISNCGTIEVIKHTDPRGVDQAFSYSSNLPAEPPGTVGGVPQGGVICPGKSAAGVQADGSFCLNDAGNSTTDSAGNTIYNNAIQAGSYNVTEGTEPGGFTFTGVLCTVNGTTTNLTDPANAKKVNITINPGDVVVCTYVNQKNTATLATQVSTTQQVFPGQAVHDTATVTGNQAADTPSGTVTFFLCTGVCTSGGTNIGTGTLSGSGATASATSPDVNSSTAMPPNTLTPGTYCFRAEWPGDTNYPAALTEFGGANGTNECFTVRTIPTTTTTTPSTGSGGTTTFGSSVTDHAIVQATQSGDGTPTGTVTFFICNPSETSGGACPTGGTQIGNPVDTAAISGSNPPASSADSAAKTVNQTGTWCWRAVYTPGGANGANYTGSSDASSGECFTVNDTTTGTSAQTWLPNDSTTVTAAHNAPLNGTLSAQLFSDGACTAGNEVPGQLYTKMLTNATSAADRTLTTSNGAAPNPFMVSASTSVSWLVTFTSSDGNVGNSGHCEVTSLTINNNNT
jgi:hypothetical protein